MKLDEALRLLNLDLVQNGYSPSKGNAGSKYDKAMALHIPIMNEEEFHQLLIDEGKILF